MERLLPIAVLLLTLPAGAAGQGTFAEEEVRAFVAAYDSAVAARDIAFLERVLLEDYVLTGASGRRSSRAQVLKYYAAEREKPSYQRISLEHANIVIHVGTDMAVVTNDYTSRTRPLGVSAGQPELTQGRHTGVFVKRDGQWMVIAEQDTEQPHDGTLMEQQVATLGREYFALTTRLVDGRHRGQQKRSGALELFSRLLADEFTCTCGESGMTDKARELERYNNGQMALDPVELMEQRVIAIDNNAAVETGKVRLAGSDGRGEIVKRYTRTWVSWGQGWQVIAEHTSVMSN